MPVRSSTNSLLKAFVYLTIPISLISVVNWEIPDFITRNDENQKFTRFTLIPAYKFWILHFKNRNAVTKKNYPSILNFGLRNLGVFLFGKKELLGLSSLCNSIQTPANSLHHLEWWRYLCIRRLIRRSIDDEFPLL